MVSNSVQRRRRLFIFRPIMGQGGADRVTLILLQSLDRNLFDISLVLMRKEGEFLADVPTDIKVHSLEAASLWSAWLPLMKLLRAEKSDILFSTCSGANLPAVIAHTLLRHPGRLILSERNILFRPGELSAKRIFSILLKNILYRRADRITAVSRGVKEDLVRNLRIAEERISVVYNPMVVDSISTLASEPVSYPWREEAPIILGVGRLVPQKNFSLLVNAFAQIRARWDVRLVILGEGPQKSDLLTLVQKRGIDDDVWFVDFDKNPFKYMTKCAMFVLSSNYEGLPGALIQAMACGAAVIATDCHSGPAEIIEHNTSGILIPVGDVDALSQKMHYLLDRPQVRQQLGEKARGAAERFSVKAVLTNYVSSLL